MKRKKHTLRIIFEALALIVIFLIAQAFLQGCENLSVFHDKDKIYGSGQHETEALDLSGFSSINVLTFGNVVLTQAENFEVTVTADDNILQYIDIYKSENTLVVDIDDDYNYQDCYYRVNVSMPHVERLVTSSAGSLVSTNEITGEWLSLVVNSAGNIQLNLDINNLQTVIRSAGNIELRGFADTHRSELSSAGNLNAFSLETNTTIIQVSSAGNGRVLVNDYLEANLSSAGSLYYKGHPQISYRISSVGNLIDAN